MLSDLLYALERGWKRLLSNGKLLFLVALLFVFPLLFIVVLERFFSIAAINVESAEQQRIAALQDAASAVILQDQQTAADMFMTLRATNPDITVLDLYRTADEDTVELVISSAEVATGTTAALSDQLKTSRITPGETFIIMLQVNGTRIAQAVRLLEINNQEHFLITEHDRGSFDTTLVQRKQDAYLVLSLIFIFLIILAYWVARQTDWQRRYQEIQQTLHDRDLFSNMIAHEFRTPLTAIKGYASFLQESESITKEELKFADTIRDSAERLVLLVNDFLEVARIQSGRLQVDSKEVDVRTVIQAVVDSLQADAKVKQLQLIYTPNLKPQLLQIDSNRVTQILTNIVSNSVKYTQSGTVEVTCEEDRQGVVIRVKDTGTGISAEDQARMFAPFERVGGVDKTGTTGTGLGMWITKQLIEFLGGTIGVESIEGVGTHVVLKFKRRQ